jgi:phosphoribosylaminoimidazolecarboxamide formyltransferase/IMP cyclohydrolase
VALVSTGGTAKALRDAGLAVDDVSDLTGFPEMMDGRVKTLHPKVHGGLLAVRDNPEHVAAMTAHASRRSTCWWSTSIRSSDGGEGRGLRDCIENIDIGGPSMIRSAAKNHDERRDRDRSGRLCRLIAEMDGQWRRDDAMTFRRRLAAKAYAAHRGL